ncbi:MULTISPECIES: Dabb family protein [Paenibacillus]|uniref:Dabb family protein n=1 Tax=Paenibacillus TaxID=44249 RepID=UPI000E25D1BD|nr:MULTISPECIES: Dabb family protein [Paenibacillus]MCM2998690.1 Dabb family protein [Paenibacillus cellulositrophicus]RED40115.1 stress responsive alpha/beta barrel protein [Paenibacillus sp. VMFN-D1]
MFEHIVLLKFKPDVSTAKKEEAVMQVYDFKGNIPGITEITAGMNVTEEKEHMQGYTLGIRVSFESQQACQDYIQHPLHQEFLQAIGPYVEGIIVMDYPWKDQD